MTRKQSHPTLILWTRVFSLIWLMLAPYGLFADAAPSFSRRYEIHLFRDGKPLKVDSIQARWRLGDGEWEISSDVNPWAEGLYVADEGWLESGKYMRWDESKVRIWSEGQVLPELEIEKGYGYYREFEFREGKWEDTTPFFPYPTLFLLLSLLITILLESIYVWIWLKKSREKLWTVLLGMAVANLFTQFGLWYLTLNLGMFILLVECIVVFLEAFWLNFLLPEWSPYEGFRFSLKLNLFSFVLGSVLTFLVSPI